MIEKPTNPPTAQRQRDKEAVTPKEEFLGVLRRPRLAQRRSSAYSPVVRVADEPVDAPVVFLLAVLVLTSADDATVEAIDQDMLFPIAHGIDAERRVDVTITVTDNETGEPVSDATVAIQDLLKEDTTDANGEVVFSINETIPADYLITVTADGYDEVRETLTVTDGNGAQPIDEYTENGTTSTSKLIDAINDWRAGEADTDLLIELINIWRSS